MNNLLHKVTTQKVQPKRVAGIKHATWRDVIYALFCISIVFSLGINFTSSKVKYISPIPAAEAYDLMHPLASPTDIPFRMPEKALRPEYDRNVGLIKWIFGQDADMAIRVFTCESGLRSEAMNTHNYDGYPDVGIAQIHVTDSHLFSVEEMKNPIANLYQAKRMFDDRGWQPWDSSKNCWN